MNHARRKFIQQAGLGISAALLSPYLSGCSPTKSGLTPFDNVGLQLYTLNSLLQQEAAATINAVAKMGYTHVETFGVDLAKNAFWGIPVADLKKMFDDLGLKTHSGHYDLDKYLNRKVTEKDNLEKYIEIAHHLGQEYIVAPITPMGDLNNLAVEDYQYAAEQLNKAGEMAKKAGLKVAYHNHFWEFRPFANGTKGLDILLAFTEPELVDFELDIFWIEKAGFSAQSYFQKYPNRFPLWHLKDIDKSATTIIVGPEYDQADFEKIMSQIKYTEVGTGAIDYINIAKEANKVGLKYAFVEQDLIYQDNKLLSIQQSLNYVKKNLKSA